MSTVPSLVATPTTTTPPASTTGASSSTSATDPAALQSQFLTLLTTQLNNQDPTNPMDDSQLTSQLAQISTVSGIGQLNQSVTALQNAFQSAQALQGASLIGQSVMVSGSSLNLSAGQAVGGVALSGPADTVSVKVTNSAGQLVQTINLGSIGAAGNLNFSWDGKDSSGAQLPDGQYQFSATATQSGKAVSATTLTAQQVTAVTPGASGVELDTSSGQTLGLGAVKEIL